MIHQIQIKIPYQKRWGIFSITVNKPISFCFDNFSLFLFRERLKIETPEDFAKWQKENGKNDLLVQAAFSAAESYCLHNRKKFDLDLKKFAVGLSSCKESELQKLIDCWKRSQEYGAIEPPGKKKVKVNR